jgi:hypothetical protein
MGRKDFVEFLKKARREAMARLAAQLGGGSEPALSAPPGPAAADGFVEAQLPLQPPAPAPLAWSADAAALWGEAPDPSKKR